MHVLECASASKHAHRLTPGDLNGGTEWLNADGTPSTFQNIPEVAEPLVTPHALADRKLP
eukprot:6191221-Pleurochrysis_carterae.AAC.1